MSQVALWAAFGAAARRYLERAQDFGWQQERRLLEAYVQGHKRRRRKAVAGALEEAGLFEYTVACEPGLSGRLLGA